MQKNSKKTNKNLNDLKLIFLEPFHLGLSSGKVWENRFFFLYPYSKLLLDMGRVLVILLVVCLIVSSKLDQRFVFCFIARNQLKAEGTGFLETNGTQAGGK